VASCISPRECGPPPSCASRCLIAA
jgi:hypothetical protein